ncbi:hypothetical protein [Streptomyces griseorubiginosus]|uniref:hypothetical protein n=1 Tax=Streptomyces griseorubiginosus TaxID=67304 RepID=UPI00113FF653|nr:hypothetical protein [Streptomyces griseorubiginosus]
MPGDGSTPGAGKVVFVRLRSHFRDQQIWRADGPAGSGCPAQGACPFQAHSSAGPPLEDGLDGDAPRLQHHGVPADRSGDLWTSDPSSLERTGRDAPRRQPL